MRTSRRGFLRSSAAGVLGMSLPQLLARASGAARPAAKNVLVILEQGGLSHIDTFDPKPELVSDNRSPYQPIATSVPGIRFTELLSHTARIAHKITVVRSMKHTRGGADAHPQGTRYVLSGAHPAGPVEMPDLGSAFGHLLGTECSYLPPYIMVPGNHEQAAEAKPGFLPDSTRAFKTGGRDLSDPSWRVGALVARPELTTDRLESRRRLMSALEQRSLTERSGGMDRFYEQAFDTLTSSDVTRAFDYQREPLRLREDYGLGHRGACYLVGRKLIEAGVRFVTVDTRWPLSTETPRGGNLNWDHHDHIYASQTCELPGATGAGAGRYGIGHWVMMGSTDRAFAALVRDLDDRGLLCETLVCFVTEFGRTPRINPAGGRDHWTNAYSIAFAGAGVPGGQVIGSSDKDGGHVTSDPHTPEDYAATLFAKLGLDRGRPLYTSNNRPIFYHEGEPIAGLM